VPGRGEARLSAPQAAEELAAAGVPVFPCGPEKRPTCPHGFKDAVLNPAGVRSLWNSYPGPLIGVPTGAASGLDVLDIDPRHGGHLWWLANRHLIPATRMHRTRSEGLHVLFLHDDRVRNSESKIAPGVDTRGEGGYAIWWPASGCEVADAPVAPWPAWLLARLLRHPRKSKAYRGPITPLDSTDTAHRLAERMLDRVASASEGQRHYKLRAAAYTLGGLIEHLPFSEAEAIHRLTEAARRANARDLISATKTAAWGIAKGKVKPFRIAAGNR